MANAFRNETNLSCAGRSYAGARPLSRRLFLLAGAAALAMPVSLGISARAAGRLKLRRGGSIHTMMNWADLQPGSKSAFAWPPFSADHFQVPAEVMRLLRRTGLDFVRITVDPGPFLQAGPDQYADLERIVLAKCRQVLDADMSVVFDFHPVNQVPAFAPVHIVKSTDSDLFRRYVAMIARTARTLRKLDPSRVALEPFNEPPYGYSNETATRWQRMLEIMHKAVRAEHPGLPLVLSGAASGGILGLRNVDASRFSDPNIFWSFHYYDPHVFTHQGVRTSQTNMLYYRYLSDLSYPAEATDVPLALSAVENAVMADTSLPAILRPRMLDAARSAARTYLESGFGRANIATDFDKVARWAAKYAIPHERIFLGEFGVARRNPLGSGALSRHRYNWLRDIRVLAEKHGFGWGLWDLNQPEMGFMKSRNGSEVDSGMLRALGLEVPGA